VIRRERDGVRLLGGTAPTQKLAFDVAGASGPAIAAVEKAGGSVKVAVVPAEAEA
jgi:large subunit ribosomal protein L15